MSNRNTFYMYINFLLLLSACSNLKCFSINLIKNGTARTDENHLCLKRRRWLFSQGGNFAHSVFLKLYDHIEGNMESKSDESEYSTCQNCREFHIWSPYKYYYMCVWKHSKLYLKITRGSSPQNEPKDAYYIVNAWIN